MTRISRAVMLLAALAAAATLFACQKKDTGAGAGGRAADQAAGRLPDSPRDTAEADSLFDFPPLVLSPDVVFTTDDIPREGGYLQLPLGDLTDAQANQLLRRLKTQYCTCGCPHSIDQCLIHDPECEAARRLATQVLKEVTGGR